MGGGQEFSVLWLSRPIRVQYLVFLSKGPNIRGVYLVSCSLIGLELESLGLLPGKDLPTKVTVGGRLLEDWVLQLQVLHNAA